MKHILSVGMVVLLLTGAARAQQPNLCVASVEGDTVRIRMFLDRQPQTEDVQTTGTDKDGKPVAKKVKITRQYRAESVLEIPASEVKVFDAGGKEVAAADALKLLKKETPVVVVDNGQKPEAILTASLKKGVVVLSIPVPLAAAPAVPAVGFGGVAPVPPPIRRP